MPTPPLPEPGKKITLILYAKDVELAKKRWGHGWTSEIRELLHNHLRKTEVVRRRF